jgi:hypothetical protein
MMEPIVHIVAIIAFVLFIIGQIYDIVRTYRFYKNMEVQHEAFIESLKGGETDGSKQVQKSSKTKTKSKHND